MGGYEYPIAFGTKSSAEQMNILFEFDTKSLYLDTFKTLSLGLRYSLSDAGQIGLSIADITGTKAIVFSGGYNF